MATIIATATVESYCMSSVIGPAQAERATAFRWTSCLTSTIVKPDFATIFISATTVGFTQVTYPAPRVTRSNNNGFFAAITINSDSTAATNSRIPAGTPTKSTTPTTIAITIRTVVVAASKDSTTKSTISTEPTTSVPADPTIVSEKPGNSPATSSSTSVGWS